MLDIGEKDFIVSVCKEKKMFFSFSVKMWSELIIFNLKSSKQKTILILGGYSKGRVNYKGIFNITLKNIKHIVCYGVEGKSIYKQLKNIFICTYIENFEKAIISAIALAKANYRVLLSPACSSFDQFNNFEERGNKFKELVKNYSTAWKKIFAYMKWKYFT